MKNYFFYVLSLLFLVSCKKDIISEKGSINVISSVYFNASKNLDNMKQIHISRMNYIGSDVVEFVPNIFTPELIDEVFYIKDTSYFDVGTYEDSYGLIFREKHFSHQSKNIYSKKKGAIWVDIPIFNYDLRKNLNDTILYEKREVKRFEINTKDNYSIYYFAKTDTIIPYSFNRQAEIDYKGRLERIDSYDKTRDLFSTIVLVHSNNLDEDGFEIFKYNEEIENQFIQEKNNNK